jgi:chromate transporter
MMKSVLSLFFTFIKIGIVTFGGGYAIMPVLERELVKGKGWITMDEAIDFYTIGQITPGVIAVNLSSFVGYKQNKIIGAIVATAGFILPGITLITLAGLLLRNFNDIPTVQNAFAGVRLAVGALIARTVVSLAARLVQKGRRPFQNAAAVLICAVCFALSLVWKINPVMLIAASGLAGFFIFSKTKNPAQRRGF